MEYSEYIKKIVMDMTTSKIRLTQTEIKEELNKRLTEDGFKPISKRVTVGKVLENMMGFSSEEYKNKSDWNVKDEFFSKNDKRFGAQIKINSGKPYLTNFWYDKHPELDDYELKFLVDSILYSKIINKDDADILVKKIFKLAGKNLQDNMTYTSELTEKIYLGNSNVIENVYIIQDAINRKKKIHFNLYIYSIKGIDKKNKKSKISMERYNNPFDKYVVSPHKIIMSNGRYYLLASDVRSKQNYKIYRIDLIKELEVIENSSANDKFKEGAGDVHYISKYIVENPYLFAGKTEKVTFRFDKNNLVQIVDWFGDNFLLEKEDLDSKTIDISVYVNLQAFKFWVLQYNTLVEVLDPKEFREEIKETIKKMGEKYETKNEKEQGD